MPVTPGEYKIEKNEDGTWRVVNTTTGEVHSKHATEEAAKHQKQLLYAVGHGWHPDGSNTAAETGVILRQLTGR